MGKRCLCHEKSEKKGTWVRDACAMRRARRRERGSEMPVPYEERAGNVGKRCLCHEKSEQATQVVDVCAI